MAYTYDEFGSPVWIDDEEERRRQELLAAQQAAMPVVEQPVAAAEMTPPSVQPVAVAPIAVARQPAVQAVPSIAPVAPQVVDQSAYTAQMESGNRPDIGYHNPQRSTAYGTYGITAPAYQDVQRANPQFAGRDITSLTPEEQKAAYNTYTNLNAQALQRLGVEPTEANQRLAHFLGARGAADYINHGYISPRAAAANGGEERVRQIAEQRLAGGNAPASGASEPYAGAGRGVMGMPQAVPGAGVQVATGQGVKGTPTSTEQSVAQFSAIADDPEKLLQFRKDTSHPEWLRQWAGAEASAQLSRDINAATATKQVEQLTAAAGQGDRQAANTIAKELQSQGGSWVKMLLLSYISPELAGEEAIKLGFGNKWQTTTDENGKPALIQVNARGLPLKGYTADGKEIPANQLVAYAGGKRNLDIVGGTYVNDTTGEVGRVVTDKNTGKSYIQTDKGVKPMTGFRPQSSTGTLADMRTRAMQDLNIKLQGKGVEEAMQILRPYNQQLVQNGFAAIQPAEVGIQVPQVGGVAQPAAGVAAPVAPQAPTAAAPAAAPVAAPAIPGAPSAQPAMVPAAGQPVVQQPQVVGAGGRPTAAQMSAAAEGQKKATTVVMDAAATEVAKSADTANTIKSIGKAVKILDSGEHNIGSYGSTIAGRGPIAQTIGAFAETKDARNTKTVMDTVNKLAADGLKSLGSNPSTVDLEFWTKFKPDASSDPQFTREWIESRSADLQRRVNYARQQLNMEPVFANEQDTSAYLWLKKNPTDPRAAAIKQKLGLQ
jgi:hypothetical protein